MLFVCQAGAERGDRLVVGESASGVITRHLEVAQGAVRLSRRGEVPPEHGGDLFRPAIRRRLQRPRGAAMQQAAFGAQQPVVDGLLDEGMPEPEGGLGEPGRLLQEALRAQLVQGRRPAARPSRTPRSAARQGELVPSTDARRTVSRAAGLSRSTRDRTRRSSAWGTSGLAVSVHPPCACSRTRALVSSSEANRSSRYKGVAFDAGQHGVQDLPAGVARPAGSWPAPARPPRAAGRGQSAGLACLAARNVRGWSPPGRRSGRLVASMSRRRPAARLARCRVR